MSPQYLTQKLSSGKPKMYSSLLLLPEEEKASIERDRTIVLIDSAVEDYHSLIAGVTAQTQVMVLDPIRDGVRQIAEILRDRPGINCLQIVCHGNPGSLQLGSAQLSLASLSDRLYFCAHFPSLLENPSYSSNEQIIDVVPKFLSIGMDFLQKLSVKTKSSRPNPSLSWLRLIKNYLLKSFQENVCDSELAIEEEIKVEEAEIETEVSIYDPFIGEGHLAMVKQWSFALDSDAKILIYGCNVGADEIGQAFVQRLSELTGAHIACGSWNRGMLT